VVFDFFSNGLKILIKLFFEHLKKRIFIILIIDLSFSEEMVANSQRLKKFHAGSDTFLDNIVIFYFCLAYRLIIFFIVIDKLLTDLLKISLNFISELQFDILDRI
jgi:hypothetical protein